MPIEKTRRNIAAVNATSTTNLARRWSGRTSQKTTTDVGFGRVTFALTDMGEWAFAAGLRLPTGRFGKRLKGSFLPEWYLTTFAVNGRALILTTFGQLRLGRTITWGKSCVRYSHGEALKTHLRSTTHDVEEAYRQPDLFVAPPPQPKQEAFEI